MLKNKNSLTLYPNYILGGYYLVDSTGNEERITQTEAILDPLNLPRYKSGDKIKINYYNGSVANKTYADGTPVPNGVSFLDANYIDKTYAPNILVSGNTIEVTQDGLYDFYMTTEVVNGKTVFILHVEQYHEVVYSFSERINPTIGTSKAIIISGSKSIQKYGDPLAEVRNPNVVNSSGVIVRFENWMKENQYEIPEQIVTENTTYYPQYDVGDQIYGANFSATSAQWNMALIDLNTPVSLENADTIIVQIRFNHQDDEFWFRPCAVDTNGIIYDAFGKEITDTETYKWGYWYSVNKGSYPEEPQYKWYSKAYGGWTPSWETYHAPTFYVEVPLGFMFARFTGDGTQINDPYYMSPDKMLKQIGIHVANDKVVDFTIGSTYIRTKDNIVVEISNPNNYTLGTEAGKDRIRTFKVDSNGMKASNLAVSIFKPVALVKD